jgi:hypothetical protein
MTQVITVSVICGVELDQWSYEQISWPMRRNDGRGVWGPRASFGRSDPRCKSDHPEQVPPVSPQVSAISHAARSRLKTCACAALP